MFNVRPIEYGFNILFLAKLDLQGSIFKVQFLPIMVKITSNGTYSTSSSSESSSGRNSSLGGRSMSLGRTDSSSSQFTSDSSSESDNFSKNPLSGRLTTFETFQKLVSGKLPKKIQEASIAKKNAAYASAYKYAYKKFFGDILKDFASIKGASVKDLKEYIQSNYDELKDKAKEKKISEFAELNKQLLEGPVRKAIKLKNEHYVEFYKSALCTACGINSNKISGKLSEILEAAKENDENLLANDEQWLTDVKKMFEEFALSNRSVSN